MKIIISGKSFEVEDEVGELIHLISIERDELKEFAIWLTGCGYDFCQHPYFCEQRDKLLK